MARLQAEGPLCCCGNLRKAMRAVTQFYDSALRPSGLRASQLGVLAASKTLGTVTVSRLAAQMVMDRTTLTRNLRPLAKARLIRLAPGKDRREREITVTPAGEEVLARAYPLWQGAQAKITKALGQKRLERLLADLAAVVEAARKR
ncbi:MAG TPA: MarR family winged helix-turn-helix transcriptional regulator [Candidatus Acidoferrales bacterium]|nr:MarR family winged helix-turn-helix transcriptional regulator [Candidatus Acidoferrales bacterium]